MAFHPPMAFQTQKVAIYIRVSTQWQVDKDSLNVQRRELIAYCELVLGIKEYVVFEDPGYSAKNTDRPDYQRMMARLRSGEFSHLLVWKIDRISRNLLDFASMYQELKEAGITFVSKNEQFDTSSAIGEAMLKIILVFAELERQITAERVTAVMLSRANEGDWNGGRVPYGYYRNKEDKQFYIEESENKVFNLVWDLYEDKQSLVAVTRYLNDHGYTTRRGGAWSVPAVYKLLTSIWYLGHYRYNVHKYGTGYKLKDEAEWITIENHHPASVGQERFDRVQFLLNRNKRGGVAEGKTYSKKNIHVFAGLVRCGICGGNMTATLDRRRANGWRPSIYACSHRRKSDRTCPNKYISDVTLGPFIFNLIANILRAKDNIGTRTTLEVLENKILRGEVFAGVDHVDGLADLKKMLIKGETGIEYKPTISEDRTPESAELEILMDRRRKDETALSRLHSLFLYGESEMAEKDYIIERAKITKDLDETNARIAELQKSTDLSEETTNQNFIQKASYFIMVQQLLGDAYVDYERIIRNIDPNIAKSFIRKVIKRIEITDGLITNVSFSNDLTLNFTYK